jgi:methyl-accepting chemotaxis protein
MSTMTLRSKLWTLVGAFAAGIVVFALFSFATLGRVKVNGPIYQGIVQQKDLLADILPPPEYLIESYLVSLQMIDADKAKLPALIAKSQALKKDFEDRRQYWAKELPEGEAKNLLERSNRLGAEFLELEQGQFIPALQRGDAAAVASLRAQLTAKYEEHRAAVDDLVKVAIAGSAAHEKDAAAVVAGKTTFSVALLIIVLLVGAGISIWIMRSVMRQLGGDPAYAAEVVKGIAQGNLALAIETRPGDQTSLLAEMARMRGALHDIIGRIRQAAESLGEAAQALSATAQQVADSSSQQSDSAASMAASIEQMTASIEHVAGNAGNAHTLAGDARNLSLEGGKHVEETIAGINAVAESVASTTQVVRSLGEQSEQISGIVRVIQEIADQTNLLALNAAIEAARAGEAGRGFAVVADEVRKLAEKTASSTQEISSMIAGIQHGTATAVEQMQQGTSRVEAGVAVAAGTGESMKQIESGAGEVLAAVDEISTALREQSVASNQISQSVERIAQMTEENGAAVAQLSHAAEDLKRLAGSLTSDIGAFRL